ncbi:MAG: DNA alkylation repair protein [Clostridia bacterium]|nr:DNA alkylation repair protein [Clostridia bacterium]
MNSIINKLIELQDKKYREFNKNLCPDTNKEMLGIRIPILRKLAKEILKENNDWKDFAKNENAKYFEEVILQGLIIAYSKLEFEEKLEYISLFVPRIDSWAICDTFVPTLKIKDEYLEKYWNYILKYLNSDKEFEIRFAVISMLDYFINDEYVDRVIEKLDKISHDGYYVKMGVAWTLAEIGIKYNEEAMKYLKSKNNLDKFTYNKTLQKMIESYRIDSKQKDILRQMKRK